MPKTNVEFSVKKSAAIKMVHDKHKELRLEKIDEALAQQGLEQAQRDQLQAARDAADAETLTQFIMTAVREYLVAFERQRIGEVVQKEFQNEGKNRVAQRLAELKDL